MAGTSTGDDHYVDDLYFSALHDSEEILPISDEKYAEELQLQEALMSAVVSSRFHNAPPSEKLESSPKKNIIERGQSSQSFCDICMDSKPTGDIFRSNTCSHSFCTLCIGKHVASKVQENIAVVKCPDMKCEGTIAPDLCRSIIPQQVFERWENALCESLILGSQKFYCPFKDCSAMLVDDGGEVVTVSECPICRRLFCAQCKVPWHSGLECREFQGLKKDERDREDIMLVELAKKKKWRRCPKCEFYVEKTEGCMHITCRCGFNFCYGCGAKHTEYHACSSTPGR